jgi:hypothetical protein
MSLSNFQEHFSNAYEEIFQKVLVAKEIANTRFEPTLRYGESIERFRYDIDSVFPRSVTRGSASTIDSVSDSTALLSVDQEFEMVFHLSDGEITQAGPLNPGTVVGGKIAHKLAQHLDGKVFAEVDNAANDFDNGDLTGALTSSGTAITLNTTTVPQMVSRMPAKLMNKENVDGTTNMVLVVDAVAASDITQYLLGKNIDLAGATFRNGYTGPVHNAEMYVSENLLGRVVIGMATNPTANDTVVINGVTFTFEATLGAAGDLHIGTAVDDTRANMAVALNDPTTAIAEAATTGYQVVSAADQATLVNADIAAANDDTANTLTITGRGRLTVSESFTATADGITSNVLNAYYGKRGGIDLVVQDMKEVDMRATDDRRGYNVFSSYLAGIKTFTDGSKQFLRVLLNNA